ncbi:MAG: hypothetical protein ACK2T6_06110 [Anaerolineae bacterium]
MNRKKTAAVAVLALALVALPVLARSASAAPVATTARPLAPAIGYSQPDGSFLAVWSEDRGTGTGLDIYGARVTRSGIVVGNDIPIIVDAGNQSDPTLAFSEVSCAYLLVYTDDGSGITQPPTTPGVPTPNPGTAFPTPGATSTAPIPPPPPAPEVDLDAAPQGSEPLVASAVGIVGLNSVGPVTAAGSFVPQTAGLFELAPNQPAPTIPPPTTGPPPTGVPPLPTPPGTPNLTPTPGGPAVPPTTAGSRDLWGTWISPSGIRFTNKFAIVTSLADDTYPDLGYIRRGGSEQFALVWREVTGTDAQISVMRLDGLGYYFVPSAKAVVIAGGDLGRPSVAGEPNAGDYFVVWAQTPTDSPARDIYGRKLNANAYPYGVTREVASGTDDQTYPSLASLGAAGGYLLTYEARQMGQVPDIRTRRLNRNGVPMRIEYNLAGGPEFSFAPDVASSDSLSTLLLWLDRNAASDNSIIAAEVNRDGRRLSPERLIVQGGSGPGAVTPIAPPPPFPTPPGPPLPTP